MKGLFTCEVVSKLFSLMMTYELASKIRCVNRGLEEINVNLYDEIR